MAFKVVIPARYASSRLPGKPLIELAGKPMIRHVYERALESGADEVVIATDDERIEQVCQAMDAGVCVTAADHHSGTDRITEVVDRLGWPDDTIVVNLQGDEPCMPAALIDQVASDMASHADARMTTLASPIEDWDTLFDPHIVKVVIDSQGYALYFSRAPIPWHRDEFGSREGSMPAGVTFYRHIGLYAYRVGLLREFVAWDPVPLERAESLEQLRVLWHGQTIHVSEAKQDPGHGVDTPDDVEKVKAQMLQGG